MDNRIARLALGLVIAGLMGCGSGGGAAPGPGEGAAGATGTIPEGGSGEAGQAGGGIQAGSTGEAAGQAGGGTQAGTTEATGGSTGTAGGGGTSTSKPAGGTASGGKTAGSAGTTGTGVANPYVDAINAVRAAVTKPANYTGTWAPLPNVVWSDTVAASAQAWADNLATTQNCKLVHESQNSYGENLAMGTNLTPKQAVDMWAGEKSLYTWSPTYSRADFDAGSGHYTQLVWRKSTQVGCGSATCARSVVISCRFSPPGNFMGQAVF
jgi:uncharacterized protein YkwD